MSEKRMALSISIQLSATIFAPLLIEERDEIASVERLPVGKRFWLFGGRVQLPSFLITHTKEGSFWVIEAEGNAFQFFCLVSIILQLHEKVSFEKTFVLNNIPLSPQELLEELLGSMYHRPVTIA